MIRKTPRPETPDGTNPIVHVSQERLVFSVPGDDGESYEIRLQEILRSGNVSAALLWGLFFQVSEMVGLQRQILAENRQLREEAKTQMANLDVAGLAAEALASAGLGGAPRPEGS